MTEKHIPEGVGFQTFDLTHILWLLAGFAVWIGGCIFYRRLSEAKRKIMLTVLGTYIVAQEIVRDLVLLLLGEFNWGASALPSLRYQYFADCL